MDKHVRLKIIHKDTGLTLRQYAKQHLLNPLGLSSGWSFKDEKISYLLHEDGSPGFTYTKPYESICTYFLTPKEWKVEFIEKESNG